MRRKRASKQPKWQITEKIVALLEKMLTPTAEVRHNVFLPVVGRPERESRQCDIVITYGQAPRQTITIVEVQDRKSRPNINTFHGWVVKMREVGAQHLICVSALGFPQSIVDDVAMVHGPTVRLMTLRELEQANMPGMVVGNFLLYKKPRYILEAVFPGGKVQPISTARPTSNSTNANLELSSKDRVYTLGDSVERLTLFEVSKQILELELQFLFNSIGIRKPDNGLLEVTLDFSEKNLFVHVDGQKYKIDSLTERWKLETDVILVLMSFLEYKQEILDGTVAWVASAKGEVEGKEFEIQVIFKRDEQGFLQLTAPKVQGADNLSLEIRIHETSWRSVIDGGNKNTV